MKRRRNEISHPSWWDRICDEIRASGGFVHDKLHFSETNRQLTIQIHHDDQDIDNNNNINNAIEPETELFRIPMACMITKSRALSLCPWLNEVEKTASSASQLDDEGHFYNSSTDIIIALAMASQTPNSLLYLQSLPESSVFDALPRRWSDDHIETLLGGTSILDRVKQAKMGVIEDYRKLETMYETINQSIGKLQMQHPQSSTSSFSFPSFDRFSDMLAAVSSRAFQIGTSTDDVALVPLLDLGDHARGMNKTRKNVSYTFVKDDKDASGHPFMLVKTTTEVSIGECVRLTYGAKGNAQLMFNFGFCIPNNLEPDGSSNDVYDFWIPSTNNDHSKAVIPLRTGPKSYSYGGFVMAIESFFEKSSTDARNVQTGESDDNDFESFLNSADGTDDDFDDLYGDKNEQIGDIQKTEDSDENYFGKAEEMAALAKFREELLTKSLSYNYRGTSLQTALSLRPCPPFYSAVLCQSELRTIYFFVSAVKKVEILLGKKNVSEQNDQLDFFTCSDDLAAIAEQTTELANAYMAIRHGFQL
jgi:hypothetical protein